MKINKIIVIAIVLFGLLVGGLGAGVFLSQRPLSVNAAPPAQQDTTCTDDDDIEHEAENEADDDAEDSDACEDNDTDDVGDVDEPGDVEEDDGNEADQAEEANVSPDQTGITADEAKAAAESAYPGAKAMAVELERENGKVIYEVELDNRLEVIVDAADGTVLGTE